MSYLISQIIWFLILTAVLWAAVGWWLRSAGHHSQVRLIQRDYDARLQSMTRARDELRDQLEQVAATRADGQLSASARTRITEHIRTLEQENAESRERLTAMGTRLEALQATARARDEEYTTLRERLAEATDRLRQASATSPPPEKLESALAEQKSTIDRLHERIATLSAARPDDKVQAEHAKLLSVIQSQKRTIEQLNQRPEPDMNSTGDTGRQPTLEHIQALRSALRHKDSELTALRAQLDVATRTRPTSSPTRAPSSGDLFSSPPTVLQDAPEGLPDDLKIINGIGPVLEAKLNDLGIYHFHQIAALSEDDIGWIAAQMNAFPNRILRDRWVQQAASLIDPDDSLS